MGDEYPVLRVAAVQAAPVFLDREATVEKACRLIREAGRHGAQVIAFPEGFIPAHPIWFHFHPATGPIATELSVELFKNSVVVPGPEVEALCEAARDAGAYVVIGVCEKLPRSTGTMFNSQLYIGPDGRHLGKHQKLMPTVGERLVHMGGYGDTFGTFETPFGPMSALICGENSNPLAVFALTAEGTRIHVASWPNHIPTISNPLPDRVLVDSRAFAQMSKAYVISACGVIDERMIAMMRVSPKDEAFLRDPRNSGGSVIVAPDTSVVAGPLGAEEAILYADIDLSLCVKMKLRHDFAGHYNRPDVFQLAIHRRAPRIYRDAEQAEILPAPDDGPRLEMRSPAAGSLGEGAGWPGEGPGAREPRAEAAGDAIV
ncbi:MAG: carbon-nitrogen hydrolase family protein [Firmicutes bacterium]|nr:carbon-nitrogen hydrolase family protein [Bacillota bacterium]